MAWGPLVVTSLHDGPVGRLSPGLLHDNLVRAARRWATSIHRRGDYMTVDRGVTWPLQYGAHERLVLRQQAKFDRRGLPARWYWRLLTDADLDGTAQDDVYGEAITLHRRYAEPIPVHIYLDPTGRQKGQKRGRTDTEGRASIGWSRSEARRVGALLGTQDDVLVGLVPGVTEEELLYIPRPGDIVQYARRLYQILQCSEDYLGPTDIVMAWSGTAAILVDDIAQPLEFRLPAPPTIKPPDDRTPEWLG